MNKHVTGWILTDPTNPGLSIFFEGADSKTAAEAFASEWQTGGEVLPVVSPGAAAAALAAVEKERGDS